MGDQFVDMVDLKARDDWVKGGNAINEESSNLKSIYMGEARDLTIQWLRLLGQGDPKNVIRPFQTKLLKRFTHTAAVVWQNPPTRRLAVGGVAQDDSSDPVRLVSRIYQRSRLNSYLKAVDRWRTLLGQAIIYASPPRETRPEKIPIRIFWPHAVMRDPDDTAQDDISQDRRVAFKVYDDPRYRQHSIWHYWEQVGPGEWNAFRVFENGELVDGDIDALYPAGVVPFAGCPFLQVYDELPEGRAWIPIDDTRTAFAMSMNVVTNDLMYLLKQQAHTVIGVTGISNQKDLPKKWGPGEMWGFEDDRTRFHVLDMNPKLGETIAVSRHLLELFSSGEGLPGDYFLASRKYETGAAGRLRQQDLDARRQDQVQDAQETELELFELVRELWNTYAPDRGNLIDPALELQVELGRQWFPVDLAQLQQTSAFDMSLGASSIIDYLMESRRLTREQAIDQYERIQVDRVAYPVREDPAALIAGRGPGGGDSFTGRPPNTEDQAIVPDESSFNPDRAASNGDNSVVGAARRALSIGSVSPS